MRLLKVKINEYRTNAIVDVKNVELYMFCTSPLLCLLQQLCYYELPGISLRL